MAMFSSVVLYFYLTSYLGWLLESTYRSISEKKIINSGFLFGPFVPIYGFGAIIIYFLSFALKDNSYVFQTTIYGFTSIFLEYLTALFFEKIFKIKLWDYSKEKINIHGRICLKFSLIWIILVVFIVEFGQKYLLILINKIPLVISNSLSVVLILYTIIDLFFSFKLFNNFAKIASFLKNVDIGELQNKINYVYKEKIMFDIKYFLKPIAKFKNLTRVLYKISSKNRYNIYQYIKQFIETFLKKETGENFMDGEYLLNEEFQTYIYDILNNPDYLKLKDYKHHGKSIYDHNILVAWLSFKVGKALKLKLKDLARGAVLHDLFYYDWRYEKPKSQKLHAFEHPKESLENAKSIVNNLSKIEEDIILKHMWPLTLTPPRYIESFLVTIIDKIVASIEIKDSIKHKKKPKNLLS